MVFTNGPELCAPLSAPIFVPEDLWRVVRLALRDVEPFLHFDTFAGGGTTAGVNYSSGSETFSESLEFR